MLQKAAHHHLGRQRVPVLLLLGVQPGQSWLPAGQAGDRCGLRARQFLNDTSEFATTTLLPPRRLGSSRRWSGRFARRRASVTVRVCPLSPATIRPPLLRDPLDPSPSLQRSPQNPPLPNVRSGCSPGLSPWSWTLSQASGGASCPEASARPAPWRDHRLVDMARRDTFLT